MDAVIEYAPLLWQGTLTTIELTLASAVLALAISFIVGLARMSRYRAVRWSAVVYLEFFRGTSALVQMFFMYFVLPLWGLCLPPMLAGIVACGCNLGSYGSEVVRSAVKSVAKEQSEAATALNYTVYQRYRYVLIPQAIPVMLPSFGNLLIELLKLTAVASLITIADLTYMAQIVRSQTALTLEPFLAILVIYFLISTILLSGMKQLEKRFSRGRNTVARQGG